MPAERYFLEESLTPKDYKVLTGSEFHHLIHVMRTRKGDRVEVVNGQGALAQAIITDIFKDRAHLLIEDVYLESPDSQRIILAQAIPKPNRLDFILEKGTELGANEFWLFPSHHSAKKDFSIQQFERMRNLTIGAMKQCGRLFLPLIKIQPALDKWSSVEGTLFFGDVEPSAPLFSEKWHSLPLIFPITFFIGPESGFIDKEILLLKEKGAHGVKLHRNILRTDTAPLVALSLMQHWLMTPHLL